MKKVSNWIVVTMVLIGLCGNALASDTTYITYVPITGDADSGISANNTYTHKLDFGTGPGATVNGVAFNAYNAGANGTLNFNRATSSGTQNHNGGNGNHNVSGNLASLMTDMYFNGGNAAGGTTTWTLSGLTAGVTYDARIYTRQWAASSSRLATFVFDPDGAGAISDSTAQLSQDDATQTPPGLSAANDAYYINYRFTAVAGEDLVITVTQPVATYSWHLYGLSCQEAAITYKKITGDADSGISTANAYTHKLDLGTGTPGATINGVAFDAYSGAANGSLNFNYSVSTGSPLAHGGNGNHNVSGNLANLMTDMYINNGNAAGGTATWTLSGLTPGRIYDARIYTRQWGVSASRLATLVFDPDGTGSISHSTGQISEDDATQSPPGLTAANDAYYINYRFTAVAGENLVITATQANGNNSWHLYGISCEDIYPDAWDGGGADDNMQTDLNWADDTKPVANDVLKFSGTTRTSPNNDFTAATQFNGIEFLNTTAGQSFSLGGNSINLGGNITTREAGSTIDDTISLDLQLTGNRTIDLSANHNLTVSGTISQNAGGRALTKFGPGTLTLAAGTTHTGVTDLQGGTTIFSDSSAFDGSWLRLYSIVSGTPIDLAFGASGLTLSEYIQIQNSSGNKTIRLDLAGTATGTISGTLDIRRAGGSEFDIDVGTDDTLTVTGSLQSQAGGGAGISKFGDGTLVLANTSSSHKGTTTIHAGTVQIGNGGTAGILNPGYSIVNNGTLEFNQSDTMTQGVEFSSAGITGSGNVAQAGSGTTILNVNNSYSGGTTVDAGTLVLEDAGRIGGGGLIVNNGGTFSVANDDFNTVPGTITINEGGTVSTDGAANNAHNIGAVFMNGGTLSSSGAAYFEGNWIFNADVMVGGSALSTISGLQVGSKGSGGTYNVADSAVGTDLLVSASMVDAAGGSFVTKTGVGTMALGGTAANTYTGDTTINAGTLILQKPAGTNAIAGNIIVGNGTVSDTLRLGASDQIVDTSVISIHGPSSGNSGKFELNGFNETIGGLVSLGALSVIQVEETGSGKNSTLTLDSSADYNFGGIIRNNAGGGGSLKLGKLGTGTLTLSGSLNSYSGGTAIGSLALATDGGIVEIQNSTALGTGAVTFEQGGTLSLGVSGLNVANPINWYNWGGGQRRILLDLPGSNSGTLSGSLLVRNGSQNCDIEVGADDTLTHSGTLTDWSNIGESWDKEGLGTLVLTGTTEHYGWIDINAGTLQFDGSLTAGRAAVRVYNGGTLSGTGSIGTLVTVNSGAHLAPGADTGTLTLGGGLTLNDGAELDIAVDTTGANDDLISVTGGTITGSAAGGVTVNVTLSSNATGSYTLMDWTAAGESGVDISDFNLVYTWPGQSSLEISGKTLVLNVTSLEETLFMFR